MTDASYVGKYPTPVAQQIDQAATAANEDDATFQHDAAVAAAMDAIAEGVVKITSTFSPTEQGQLKTAAQLEGKTVVQLMEDATIAVLKGAPPRPSILIASPAADSSFTTSHAAFTPTCTVTALGLVVDHVNWKIGATNIGDTTTAPYTCPSSINPATLTPGTFFITATVFTKDGQQATTSLRVFITAVSLAPVPTISITSPGNGATITTTTNETATVAPGNGSVTINNVQWSLNGRPNGNPVTVAPYTGPVLNVTDLTVGVNNVVSAVVTQSDGQQATDTKTVTRVATAPTISVTFPAINVAIPTDATPTAFAATATAASGQTISRVDFFVDGNGVSDSSSPYTGQTLPGALSVGPHTLEARVTQSDAQVTSSGQFTITVTAVGTFAANITGPVDQAMITNISRPVSVFKGTATPAAGKTIASVVFTVPGMGSTTVTTPTSGVYIGPAIDPTKLAAGPNTITMTANQSDSTSVTVTRTVVPVPTAANTGYRIALSASAATSVSALGIAAGGTVTGRHFSNEVTIDRTNVTLQDCWFDQGVYITWDGSIQGTTFDHCEFGPATGYPAQIFSGNNQAVMILYTPVTLRYCNVHTAGDGLRANGNTLVQYTYIHDLYTLMAGQHNDCIQTTGIYGSGPVTFQYLSLENPDETSCIMLGADDGPLDRQITVDWVYLNGGNYSFYGGNNPGVPGSPPTTQHSGGPPSPMPIYHNILVGENLHTRTPGGPPWYTGGGVYGPVAAMPPYYDAHHIVWESDEVTIVPDAVIPIPS